MSPSNGKKHAPQTTKPAIRLKPHFAEPNLFLGEALQESDRASEAVAEIQAALRLNPDYPQAYNALANAYVRLGKVDDAITQYGKALSFKPDYAEAHTNLMAVWQLKGRPQEAIAQHERALRLRPDFVEAHANLGKALQALGRPDEVLAAVAEPLRLYPRDARLREARARAYGEQGKRMLQHPEQAEVYLLRGSLPAAIEQLELARSSGEGNFYEMSVVDARLKELRAEHARDVQEQKKAKQ